MQHSPRAAERNRSRARLDLTSLNHHGNAGGAPGSSDTPLLRLLSDSYPGPVIALDAKGSPELADTVWALPGHVWEIGGRLKPDLLDPEPATPCPAAARG